MNSIRMILLAGLALGTAALASASPAGKQVLFNGTDLSNWDSYLGPRYDPEKKDFAGEPIGANNDPDGVFSVVEVDGAPAIHISGQHFGAISTKDEFENFHLRVQFKWGEKRWAPRADTRRDSGVLYHSFGPNGVAWSFWMSSQEFQVQEHDCGDYWPVGKVAIKSHVRTFTNDEGKPAHVYAPAGELMTFYVDGPAGSRIRHSVEADYTDGRWNTLDLYCLGQTSMHVVNGVLVMVLNDSERTDGAGGNAPLTKGRIQIQSEGAEVYYRDITVEPIERLPDLVAQESK